MSKKIMIGDIGGTHTRMGLCEKGAFQLEVREAYSSRAYQSLDEIIATFRAKHSFQDLAGAGFGVAGPVEDGTAKLTNLPWRVSRAHIREVLGIRHVVLMNDLEALAHGVLTLKESERETLTPHLSRAWPRHHLVVLAAGTGLGEAGVFWTGQEHIPFATEGGHSDFSPNTDREIQLLQFLQKKFSGHVSWERVLSGQGLLHLAQFLTECEEKRFVSPKLHGRLEDPREITRCAREEGDPLAIEVIQWFLQLYGRRAGNLALSLQAGGVYIAGRMAREMLSFFSAGHFMGGFVDKGRFADALSRVQVEVVTASDMPLRGLLRVLGRGEVS